MWQRVSIAVPSYELYCQYGPLLERTLTVQSLTCSAAKYECTRRMACTTSSRSSLPDSYAATKAAIPSLVPLPQLRLMSDQPVRLRQLVN